MATATKLQRTSAVSLRQLRAFKAVAEYGSVTLAAQRMHLTPSALSMLISSLEDELGVRLFDRTTRRMALSESGEDLSPTVTAILAQLDGAIECLHQSNDRRGSRLSFATSPLLAATLVPSLLQSFKEVVRDLRVELQDLPVNEIAEAVRSGQVDFGVCTADANAPDLRAAVLYQDRLVLACHHDHVLAQQSEVQWRELLGESLVLLRPGSGLRTLVEQGFSAHHESVEPAYEVSQVTTAMGLVAANLAVTILPSYALASAHTAGVVSVALTEPFIGRNIVALTSPQRRLSAASEAFLAHFRQGMQAMQVPDMQACEPNRKVTKARAPRRN